MATTDGGPAFPCKIMSVETGCYVHRPGMSLRDYACIQLRIPDTGKPWLDAIIRKARTDWMAETLAEREKESDDAKSK